jgi:hypothetical protein
MLCRWQVGRAIESHLALFHPSGLRQYLLKKYVAAGLAHPATLANQGYWRTSFEFTAEYRTVQQRDALRLDRSLCTYRM